MKTVLRAYDGDECVVEMSFAHHPKEPNDEFAIALGSEDGGLNAGLFGSLTATRLRNTVLEMYPNARFTVSISAGRP